MLRGTPIAPEPHRPWGVSVRVVAGLMGMMALAGCQRAPEPPAPLSPGVFRAVLETPGGELPFGLEIAEESSPASGEGAPPTRKTVLFLINGPERVRVPEVTITAGVLKADMPGYENELVLEEREGQLTGTVKILRKRGEWKTLSLRGTRGQTHRFFPEHGAVAPDTAQDSSASLPAPEKLPEAAGRWSVVFTDSEGKPSAGIAELQQHGRLVTGTVLTPTGDHRFLAGEVQGNELLLSRFDGGTAFLYRLKFSTSGRQLQGEVYYGNWGRDAVLARRDANAVLPDADTLTHLRNPGARFDFTFPDLEGNPVSLSDTLFDDKVVVVMLGGSWCPNCHDEAEFMAPFVRERAGQGLAAVMLMFEHFGDMPQAVQAVKRFRDEYGITYPLLIAGTSDKDDAGSRMPQLDRIYAFPTTLVIDRKGRVRKIHTGFNGPATGVKYEEFKREFTATIDKLLAERA